MNKGQERIKMARAIWASERRSGKNIRDALDAMKPHRFGLSILIDAVCEEEDMDTLTLAKLIEERGDYEDFL